MKKLIPKTKDHAFKKDVYLLGTDKDGIKYWLEAPSWDCDRYWGFGYIETYRRNWAPSKARDIEMHTHWDSSIVGFNKNEDGRYCANPFDSIVFADGSTTFTESEGWKLGELFARFYLLQKSAEMFDRGGMNISGDIDPLLKRDLLAREINRVMIPNVTAEIIKILTPKE